MRKLIYMAILLALCFAPLQRADIAQLLPVQAVAMYMEDEQVVLETDTGALGRGADVSEALDDLREKTPAVVYLDTADFLLVAENAVSQVVALSQHIKESVKVCVCEANGRVKAIAEYLNVHGNLPKLRQWIVTK